MSHDKLYDSTMLMPGDKVYNLEGDILVILVRRTDDLWLVRRIKDGQILHMTDDLTMIETIIPGEAGEEADTSNDPEIEQWLSNEKEMRNDHIRTSSKSSIKTNGRRHELGEVTETGIIYLPTRS